MSAPRPTPSRTLLAGAALVLLGVLSWVLYALAAKSENRSYDANGAPPVDVRVVSGHTYWLAVPKGTQRLKDEGLDPSKLTCTAAAPGAGPGALSVEPAAKSLTDEPKFVNRIASFVAGFSGRAHIECSGIGAVYVENAADAGYDWSGLWLVLATAALVVGAPLTLAGLRRASALEPELPVGAREYDEVQ